MPLKWELVAPAKINLGLRVLYRLENNYHHILSLMVPISLCDVLLIEESESFRLTLRSELPAHFSKEIQKAFEPRADGSYDNILYRAYHLLEKDLRAADIPPLHIEVVKRIPSPSGLGGASSNAAQFLLFLNEWLKMPFESLVSLAQKLGSDVPFFLQKGAALVHKTGERLFSLPLKNFSGYVGLPDFGFPTGKMYELLKKDLHAAPNSEAVPKEVLAELLQEIGWLIADWAELPQGIERQVVSKRNVEFSNDFWAVICQYFPQEASLLGKAKQVAQRHLSQVGRTVGTGLSGSGPAIYAITEGQVPLNLAKIRSFAEGGFCWYPIEGLV
ncbi:MAG: hypothetical protein NZM25_06115 [Leptospiraceae bacterium]|nr:hypothetical protein [Leptospiraceae bacterium]MDW8306650.1 hypothetical protein [Leptospiraceae bacterium]